MSTLGIARSLSDDPKVLQILEKIIDTVEENMPALIKDNEKTERSAQDNFTNFLQSFDQSLINIRDAIRYSHLLFQNRIPIGNFEEFRGHFLTGILVESRLLTIINFSCHKKGNGLGSLLEVLKNYYWNSVGKSS